MSKLAELQIENDETITDAQTQLLRFGANDVGNAEAVLHLYAIAYTDVMGWLVNVGTHWASENASHTIRLLVIETLKARGALAHRAASEDDPNKALINKSKLTTSNINNAMRELMSLSAVSHRLFDNDPYSLNCLNGVVDLRNGTLTPHDPAQKFTYCINAEYHPQTDYSIWHDWVTDAVGRDEIARYLQRAVGYTLSGDTSEECLFYLYGKPRAGKGTFTETLLELMGRDIGRTINLSSLTHKDGQNFELAPLRTCRAVFSGETERRNALNAARVKEITGGDDISCAFKGKDFFTYRPSFKIWISSNWQVNSDVDDDAVWTRVKVIEFVNSHTAKPDKSLKAQMKSAENLERVLAWAVGGAIEWHKKQCLTEPTAVTNAVSKHRDDLDYIQKFLDDCSTVDEDGYVSCSMLYHAYRNWCEDEGAKAAGVRTFSQSLQKKGYGKKLKKPTGQKPLRVYTGLTVKND